MHQFCRFVAKFNNGCLDKLLNAIGAAVGIGLDFAVQVHQKGFDNVDYSQVAVAGLAGAAGAGLGKLAVQIGRAYFSGAASSGIVVDTAGAMIISGTVAAEGCAAIGAAAAGLNGVIDYAQGDRDSLPSLDEIHDGGVKGFVSAGVAGEVGAGSSAANIAEAAEVLGQVAGKAAECSTVNKCN